MANVLVRALINFDTTEWGVKGPFVQGQTFTLPQPLAERLSGPGFYYVEIVQEAKGKKWPTAQSPKLDSTSD